MKNPQTSCLGKNVTSSGASAETDFSILHFCPTTKYHYGFPRVFQKLSFHSYLPSRGYGERCRRASDCERGCKGRFVTEIEYPQPLQFINDPSPGSEEE